MYSWFNNTGNSTRPFVDWHHTRADMRYLPGSSSFYVLNVRGGPGNKTRLTQGLWIQVTYCMSPPPEWWWWLVWRSAQWKTRTVPRQLCSIFKRWGCNNNDRGKRINGIWWWSLQGWLCIHNYLYEITLQFSVNIFISISLSSSLTLAYLVSTSTMSLLTLDANYMYARIP